MNSWNYILSMRHHHELPLTGVMELRPDQMKRLLIKSNRISPMESPIFSHKHLKIHIKIIQYISLLENN